jgi:hypothetical protein
MVATKDGMLYMACSGVNKVAVADISGFPDLQNR